MKYAGVKELKDLKEKLFKYRYINLIKMSMKGISPMIATVLLIAFTVAVGGIVSLFLTGLTTTQTGISEQAGTNTTRCAAVSIDILDVSSTRIIYANPSTQALTNIIFTTSDGTSVPTGALTLNVGATNSTTWTRGTNTSVRALGLCQGLTVVRGSCASGESCWS